MSQLYKLFCEGLKSRTDGEGLSSTVIVTSTPLEDEDIAGNVVQPPPVPEVPLAAQEVVTASQSSSVQVQVGSASTESPSGDNAVYQAVPICENFGTRVPSHVLGKVLSSQSTSPGQNVQKTATANDSELEKLAGPLQEQNSNVSSTDFVDKLIAGKVHDEALCRNQRCAPKSNISSTGAQSTVTDRAEENPQEKCHDSESSETDFEGAEEYYRKFPCANPAFSTPAVNKTPPKRNRNSSEGTSDESNINLVMLNVTSSSKSSLDRSPDTDNDSATPPSLTAARCRIYTKQQKSPLVNKVQNVAHKSLTSELGVDRGNSQDKTSVSNSDPSSLISLLKGVVACVEVRSGHDNRSMGVKTQLRNLGATVVDKMCKQVTHVVFNEGSHSTLLRARNQKCHLVSVLWIDACKQARRIAPEEEHPPFNLHLYEDLGATKRTKYRKMKSLQPDFEEGKAEERLNNYIKRFRRKAHQVLSSKETKGCSPEKSGEEESDSENSSPKQSTSRVSNKSQLKRLSVVLTRIDDPNASESPTSGKRNKRQLMPLRPVIPTSLSLENFDFTERIRPEFPYNAPSTSKQSSVLQVPPSSQTIRRRSSCFVRDPRSTFQSQYSKKKGKQQMRTMVCTFMHRRDIDVVAAVIKQLGGWILEPTVSSRTTHVVCGDSKRTINLLRGIAHGCWILHQEWVMRSLEAGHWLDEESFELKMFPAIQQCRVARETLGVCSKIFRSAGAIYVAKETTPPQPDLLDLLKLCGGTVVNSARQAKIVIGGHPKRTSISRVTPVRECWVLDSIQENMLQPIRRYLL